MSLARGQKPFICIRCQSALLVIPSSAAVQRPNPFRQPPSSQSPRERLRLRSTTCFDSQYPSAIRHYATRTKSANRPSNKKQHKKIDSADDEEPPTSEPQPVTWTSLLQTKSLGESRSVLVLRDLERGRSPQLGKEHTTPSAKDVKPDEILASLSELKNAEGQEEVNKYIDGLRPTLDGASLSKQTYDELIQKLVKSFDGNQLERYRLIVRGEDTLSKIQENSEQDESSRAHSFFSERTGRSAWQPHVSRPLRAKKAIMADSIIRRVWQCEVEEEKYSTGRQSVYADEDCYHLLLLGGANSILSSIGQNRSVKIDASLHKGRATLRIHGLKDATSEAADDIERLLMGVHKSEFTLNPFKIRSIGFNLRDPGILSRYSEKCKSIIELSSDMKKLVITGISKSDAEETQRILLQSLHIPTRTKRKLLSSHVSTKDGALWPVESDQTVWSPVDNTGFGRFGSSFSLSTKTRDIRTELLSQSCIDSAVRDQVKQFIFPHASHMQEIEESEEHAKALRPMSNVHAGEKLPVSANFGSILHPLYTIDRSKFSDKYQFVHNLPGLRQILYHFAEKPLHTARYLTVMMRPLPSGPHGFKTGIVYPSIRILFRLEVGVHSQRLEIGRVEAIQERREAHVLLPRLPVDLQFSRDIARPMDLSPELQSFMLQIQQSLLGYGHLSIPSLGKFPVSRILDREQSLQAPRELVEYYLAFAELSESIQLDLSPYELVYRRFNSVPAKREPSESLSLNTILPGRDHSTAPSAINDGADPFESFIQKTEEIVKTLTRNVGEKFREDMISIPSRPLTDSLKHPNDTLRLSR